jgi:hypothetical protein
MPLVKPVLHADIARLTEIHQFPDGTIVETLHTHAALELLDRREHYLPIPEIGRLTQSLRRRMRATPGQYRVQAILRS